MEDADDRCPARLGFGDEVDDGGPVGGVEGCRRFVEEYDGIVDDEAAGDINTLLLATGEGGWCERPEPFGNVEAREQRFGERLGLIGRHAVGDGGSCHDLEGGHPRDDAQELANIADRAAADFDDLPRFGGEEIDGFVPMYDEDFAGVRLVIGVKRAQERRLAGTGGTDKADAFTGFDREFDIVEDRQDNAALGVQREGLGKANGAKCGVRC